MYCYSNGVCVCVSVGVSVSAIYYPSDTVRWTSSLHRPRAWEADSVENRWAQACIFFFFVVSVGRLQSLGPVGKHNSELFYTLRIHCLGRMFCSAGGSEVRQTSEKILFLRFTCSHLDYMML